MLNPTTARTRAPLPAPTPPDADAFIVLVDGAELHLQQPAPGSITAAALAWSLAQLNRFTGHARRPYSVAEHSLLVAEILEREHGVTANSLDGAMALMAGLMHDAHEAFCGDLHTPGKRAVGPGWRQFEGRLEHAVHNAFALHGAMALHGELVKFADLQALATERRDLLPPAATPWACLAGVEPLRWVNLASPEREAMAWSDWRDAWLARLDELDYARNYFAGFAAEARP